MLAWPVLVIPDIDGLITRLPLVAFEHKRPRPNELRDLLVRIGLRYPLWHHEGNVWIWLAEALRTSPVGSRSFSSIVRGSRDITLSQSSSAFAPWRLWPPSA